MAIALHIDTAGGSNFEGYSLRNVGTLRVGAAALASYTLEVTGTCAVSGAFACNGETPQTKAALDAACTDLPSAIALLNQVRTALINFGIAS